MGATVKTKLDATRRRILWVSALPASLLVGLALYMAIDAESLVIAYHKRGMASLAAESAAPAPPRHSIFEMFGINPDNDWIERHDYHQSQLVAHGFLVHRRFVFDNVKRSTTNSHEIRNQAFAKAMSRVDDPYISVSFSYPVEHEHTNLYFDLVDRPEKIKEWETFVAKNDKMGHTKTSHNQPHNKEQPQGPDTPYQLR